MSAIVLNPALNVSDSGGHGSGSWTMMNLRLPLSSTFISNMACAVGQDPEKKSQTISSFLVSNIKRCLISFDGLG